MAAKRDLYEVLGISKTADEKTIKKAYRKLAKKYHPDMNPGDKTAEQKFKEATDAYNILSDPEKRKLYDQYGHAAFDGTGAESEFYKNYQNYGGAHGGYQEFHFEGGDGDVCSVAEETTKDSIEAVSIKEVLALLMDLEVVDSEVDPSDRKVPTHTQISLLVLMKRLRAAIKSFICKIKMVRCSHYRFIYQPELIQEKVSA